MGLGASALEAGALDAGCGRAWLALDEVIAFAPEEMSGEAAASGRVSGVRIRTKDALAESSFDVGIEEAAPVSDDVGAVAPRCPIQKTVTQASPASATPIAADL